MRYQTFVDTILTIGGFHSADEAATAAFATLTTLATRIDGREGAHLAAELPVELSGFFAQDDEPSGEPFGLAEFHHRVAELAEVDDATGARYAEAVVAALAQAMLLGDVGASESDQLGIL